MQVALTLYAIQLALNLSWSVVFFGLRRPGLGLVVIVALFIAVAATAIAFNAVSPTAAWMLAPYLRVGCLRGLPQRLDRLRKLTRPSVVCPRAASYEPISASTDDCSRIGITASGRNRSRLLKRRHDFPKSSFTPAAA